jgi:O-antigen/teichoic acid export membrane protein
VTTPSSTSTSASPETAPDGSQHLRGVARGGALNLVGAVIWGASNFALLAVLTRTIGAEAAGIVILGIAVFNILATVGGLGCSSGLVRHISAYRASGQTARIPKTLLVALVPVALVGVILTLVLIATAPFFADLFGAGSDTAGEVSTTLRWMAPLLPVAATYTVLLQGTRGFDTMRPVVLIDKIGRGLCLPFLAWGAAGAGLSPAAIGLLWASTTAVALVPTAITMFRLTRRATAADQEPARVPPTGRLARDYWRFTAPRGVGQVSEVLVNWMDTVIVGAILGTAAAGIYGAGTRYVLPGIFVGDAIIQVVAPKISGLLHREDVTNAGHLLRVATGWQSMIMWPLYCIVLVFAPVLLGLFGTEVVEASAALRYLAVGVMVAALAGPAAAIILMSGRSMLAMGNTLVLLVVNLVGNLLLVPKHGISAAGLVWAITIVIATWLPGVQALKTLGVRSWGAPGFVSAALAGLTVLPLALGARAWLGQSWTAVAVGGAVGSTLYALGIARWGGVLELDVLRSSLLSRRKG